MQSKTVFRTLIIFAIIIINIGCDRISKNVVRESLDYNQTIGYVNNYVTLTKVENTGAFLSVGNSLPKMVRVLVLIILPLLVLVFAFYFLLMKKNISALTLTGLSFIIAGGIGNLYDRVMFGSVTDFLHINFVIFQTGIFNMADVSIMAGMFLILLQMMVKRKAVI